MPGADDRQTPVARLIQKTTQLPAGLAGRAQQATTVYLLVLGGMFFAYLAATPVSSGDTDLWYHINGGRLLFEFDTLPDTAFYSFFASAGDSGWVNYFWGFQALSYLIHDALGYPGLIGLRLLLGGVTFAAATALLVRPGDNPAQRAWALALLGIVLMVYIGRSGLIRPHLVSYAMIPLFILILQHHRRWLPALPLLTIVWVNLHGTEWPVGALICGGFALRALWDWHLDDTPGARPDVRLLAWTSACLPATFVNPFGPAILTAPFNLSADAYLYISELLPYPLESLFTLNMTGPILAINGAVAVHAWSVVVAVAVLLMRGKLPLAPILLALGGAYLLSRGVRFAWEWLLLSLPLLRAALDTLEHPALGTRRLPGIAHFVLLVLLSAPLATWAHQFRQLSGWPLDSRHLPVGVANFIAGQGLEGKLLAPGTPGGYLAWRLYPDVLIGIDMQIPPSRTWDHFRQNASTRNGASLAHLVARYDPGLIAVEDDRESFAALIAEHPEYRPVFFDDVLVLYADSEQYPETVAAFELTHIDPYDPLESDDDQPGRYLGELRRVLAIDPDGRRVQHAVTRALFDAGRYTEALEHAEKFAHDAPDEVNAHFLVGNSLENLDRFDEAEMHFLDALAYAPDDFRPVLFRHLGACAYLRKDFAAAVKYFEQGINPFTELTEPEAYLQYAISAAIEGDTETAATLARQLLFTLPLDETDIRGRTEALLADVSQ